MRASFSPDQHSKVPDSVRRTIHQAIEYLASVCDGAQELDGEGFSKNDTEEGHWLSGLRQLDDEDLKTAAKLCIVYQRQLDRDVLRAAKQVLGVLG